MTRWCGADSAGDSCNARASVGRQLRFPLTVHVVAHTISEIHGVARTISEIQACNCSDFCSGLSKRGDQHGVGELMTYQPYLRMRKGCKPWVILQP
ncbi:hypothetical protein KC19_11G077700 [Ceratodon purpureus]|uniref:Uncharacterized protein n=1 Tax=Ceratodon purpureus TaxID=3225 RepID=A0A8T0GEL2_CERPU|nr:hypothetical protein KC19_N039100 [Ceratodon purpureus]KAG0556764.1 hypothetical protein KC19_11G077700 [Ceratodon purpureus]